MANALKNNEEHEDDQAKADLIAFSNENNQRKKSRNLLPLKHLLPLVFKHRGRVIAALIALLAAAGAMLAIPLAVRRVIDHGFSAVTTQFIDQYFGMMMAVVAVLALASASRYYFVTWIGERLVADLRDKVFSHLLTLSPAFYETAHTGEVLSRLTADTTQLKSLFGSTVSVALRNIFMFIGAVVMMAVTSLKFSGLVLLAIAIMVPTLVVFGRRVRKLSRDAQDTLAGSAALAQETLGAVKDVQANNQEGRMSNAFAVATQTAFDVACSRTWARAILTALIIFIAFGSVVGVLWLGAQDVVAGRLSPGSLSQFVLYAVFAAGALGSLSEVWGEVQLAAGAAERLQEIQQTEPLIKSPVNPETLPETSKGSVVFDHVDFAYPSRPDDLALADVSISVGQGKTVAVVGPSGAGKSTLFGLITRFYDPQEGKVLVDGHDAKKVDPKELRARIASVPQEPVLFSTSIFENIRFGRPDASKEDVLAAANAARVDEFVERLPAGMDEQVGERGTRLSGGQRQRIAIARAILRDAPILLLDEATSALDAESEKHVQEALAGLMKGRTTLVIAHRLATVREADEIIVLEQGSVVARGDHAELLKKDGLYQRLAKLQFSDA
jgi:ATP-binding cassette subfamily B protein